MTTPLDVLAAVGAEFNLAPTELTGRSRQWPLMPARRVAYRLLRDDAGLPWAEVARTMGRAVSGDIANGAARANPFKVDAVRARLETQAAHDLERYRWWQRQLELCNEREMNNNGC